MASSNLYEVLGVPRTATEDDIRRAYKKQALRWHPDKNPDNRLAAEVKFKQVAQAYEVLSNAASRYDYDRTGRLPGEGGDMGAASCDETYSPAQPHYDRFSTNSGPGYGRGEPSSGFAFRDPFDLFQHMFASMAMGGGDDDENAFFFGDPLLSALLGGGRLGQPSGAAGQPLMGSTIVFSSLTSSSGRGIGGSGGATQITSTTTIENGRKVTRTVKRVFRPDGTVHEDVDEKVELLSHSAAHAVVDHDDHAPAVYALADRTDRYQQEPKSAVDARCLHQADETSGGAHSRTGRDHRTSDEPDLRHRQDRREAPLQKDPSVVRNAPPPQPARSIGRSSSAATAPDMRQRNDASTSQPRSGSYGSAGIQTSQAKPKEKVKSSTCCC